MSEITNLPVPTPVDIELKVMKECDELIKNLNNESQARVLYWLQQKSIERLIRSQPIKPFPPSGNKHSLDEYGTTFLVPR